MSEPTNFHTRAVDALGNPQLRANFRNAMDSIILKRQAEFPDADELTELRSLCDGIRSRALSKLPELLEQLEIRLIQNGIQVHWAEDSKSACQIIESICAKRHAKTMIKGKSMVSEEIHLNAHLESKGLTALESDLGEYIVQLGGEGPSHIIMPAIHRNKKQIAELFHTELEGVNLTDDVDELTAIARRILRQEFKTADVGLSGVNFAVAETGTLCLVENEGNGRMCTTIPKCHIAITGIEKVVENLEDVAPLYSILTRSATGQHATTYFNWISGPRKESELDGPDEVHLVLLDNGRSLIHETDALRETLKCIRCGACMNHCPVYTKIGGHAYGTTYPGPIGQILMPQLEGIKARGDMISACTLNAACGEVCPVNIPIPALITKLRHEAVSDNGSVKGAGSLKKPFERAIWAVWTWLYSHPEAYRLMTWIATRFRALVPEVLMRPWTTTRSKPPIAKKTMHELMRERS